MSIVDREIAEGVKALAGNGRNGKTVGQKIALESFGFTIAEVASMLAAFGTVAVADQVAPAPLDAFANVLADNVIEPYLDRIEGSLDSVCKLDECKRDPTKTRKERAFELAKTAEVFALSFLASFATKLQTRRMMNKSFGIEEKPHGWLWQLSPAEMWVLGSDEVVHYGSIALFNMNKSVAQVGDVFIRGLTGAFEDLGYSKKKAKELAFYVVEWELPNGLGLAAGCTAIYLKHKHPNVLGLRPEANGTAVQAAEKAVAEVFGHAVPETPLRALRGVIPGETMLGNVLDRASLGGKRLMAALQQGAAHLHLPV